MNPLEEIHIKIIEDLDKKDALSKRILGSNGTFILTSDFNDSKAISTSSPFKLFKPSKPLIITGILCLIFAWLTIFYCIATQKNLNQLGLGIVMFTLFIVTVNILWQFFYDPTLTFTLRVDQFGIGTEDQFFSWEQIQETSILQVPLGKGHAEYLVVILSDGDYWPFDLSNFRGFFGIKKTLSKYIEYYKAKRE
jgi:hypothetical protein